MTKLTLEYWEDEGWLVGRIVEVPGVFSQGETLDDLASQGWRVISVQSVLRGPSSLQ